MKKLVDKILHTKFHIAWPFSILGLLIIILLSILTTEIRADELVHKFKSPSFSGISTSSHYLTIENQEKSRRDAIQKDIESAILAAQREAENTTMAKFMRNLESRIYSTLAKDISESLFNYSGDQPDPLNESTWVSGTINLEGNLLTWINNGSTITLIIEEYLDGVLVSTTEIVIPIGSFGGCWSECDG